MSGLDRSLAGSRVKLLATDDLWTKLHPGDEGTAKFVDDMGTLHVEWDNGCSLGLIPNADRWELLT